MYFDSKFEKREKKRRTNFDIDDNLYCKLEDYKKIYDATINDLINACIENLLHCSELPFYEVPYKPLYVAHPVDLKESNYIGLEKLKDKYGVSLFRLVNMAIHFTINQP